MMFSYAGGVALSMAAAVIAVETQMTGRRSGKEMTVNRELFPPARETMAPRIVVHEAIAIDPAPATDANNTPWTTGAWRKKR